mgnify:CR=1 FL=1
MTEPSKKPAEKLYPVVIAVETHHHAGKLCKKGEKLQVSASTKAFMIEHKLIEEA